LKRIYFIGGQDRIDSLIDSLKIVNAVRMNWVLILCILGTWKRINKNDNKNVWHRSGISDMYLPKESTRQHTISEKPIPSLFKINSLCLIYILNPKKSLTTFWKVLYIVLRLSARSLFFQVMLAY